METNKEKEKLEAELKKLRADMNASLSKKRNGKKENVWDFVNKINEVNEKLQKMK